MKKWLLPHTTADKLRKLAKPLFYENEWPMAKKRVVFWRVLNRSLSWVHVSLLEAGLEPEEANSEIFLLCCELFKRFDKDKSSIVPFIQNTIRYRIADLINKYTNNKEIPSGLTELKGHYELDEEYYLSSPSMLFEKKWLPKSLSQAQKNLILKILTTDSPTLRSLADKCRLSTETIRTQLQNIAAVIKDGY